MSHSLLDREIAALLETEPELLPFMKDLLAGLEELGGGTEEFVALVEAHAEPGPDWRMLDLGCGKGALSIAAAQSFACRVFGIDGYPPFVRAAGKKAAELGLSGRCHFEAGDLRTMLKPEPGFDLVIFAAMGDLLGSIEETVGALRGTVVPGGFIYIDDGYLKNDEPPPPGYDYARTKSRTLRALAAHGDRIVAERLWSDEKLREVNRRNTESIRGQARILAKRFPEKRSEFEAYVARQERECTSLETALVTASWLLQRV